MREGSFSTILKVVWRVKREEREDGEVYVVRRAWDVESGCRGNRRRPDVVCREQTRRDEKC